MSAGAQLLALWGLGLALGLLLGVGLGRWWEMASTARAAAEARRLAELRARSAPPPVVHVDHVQLPALMVFGWLNERGLVAVPQGPDWWPRKPAEAKR